MALDPTTVRSVLAIALVLGSPGCKQPSSSEEAGAAAKDEAGDAPAPGAPAPVPNEDDAKGAEPAADPPSEGQGPGHDADTEAERFVFTLSGPAFATPQTFSIQPDLAKPHIFADSFTLRFQDHFERTAVSEDGSSLEFLMGGVSIEGLGPGSHSLGATEGSSNGFSLRLWLQAEACPRNYAGCKNLTLQTRDGTLEVSKYQLGHGISRPQATGPTMMAATFEVEAEVTAGDREGEVYTMTGAYALVE